MFNFLKKWFAKSQPEPTIKSPRPRPRPRPQPQRNKPAPQQPDMVKLDPNVAGTVVSNGPGKNVLVRNKYQQDDLDTDTLRILDDDELVDDDGGIDPYNTGNFDRSKNWDKRFRK